MLIGACNTRPGSSATACVPLACSAPWDASPPASITRSSNRSGPRCYANSWTVSTGPHAWSWRRRSSNGSKASTTPAGDTRPWECCHHTNTKHCTSPPKTRHDHQTETVRINGSSSLGWLSLKRIPEDEAFILIRFSVGGGLLTMIIIFNKIG